MARRKSLSKPSLSALVTKLSPKSVISEQYRTVRTNIQFSFVDKDLMSLMVTSAGPNEGKSTVTANLAIVFAQQGKKVLLVDADMRKPTLQYLFRLDNRSGLSNILVGDSQLEDTARQTGIDNLDVLTCGPIPPNPSELLGSKMMESLLQQANEQYDLVIFDTPPVLAVADPQVLANICDASIMVIRSKQTEYDTAQKAKDLLLPAKAKLIGTILNDRDQKKSNYYYYYGNK